jgi:signal transduction histidine kinase/ActR/RegA family two-component response regulator
MVIICLLALAIPAFTAWGLLTYRMQVLADTEQRARNNALLFASHAARSFGENARVLDAIATKLRGIDKIAAANSAALDEILRSAIATEPQFQSLGIVDASGIYVANTLARALGTGASSRPYFQKHKDDGSAEMSVGTPLIGRTSSTPILSLSKRLSATDGSFDGVLIAFLAPSYFSDFYTSVALGDNSVIELVNESGIVLVDNSATAITDERRTETWSRRELWSDRGVHSGRATFASDGIDRIFCVAPVGGRPLSVQVAISVPFALGTWYRHVYQQAAVVGLAELGFAAAAFMLWRQYRRLLASDAARRRNADLLEKTIASMADAVLVVDAAGRVLLSNPSFVAMFGDKYPPGSPEWRKLYRRYLPDGTTPYPKTETPVGRVIRGLPVDNIELLVRNTETGRTIHFIANGRLIRDDKGRQTGAVLVYRDVTQAKETERQLRQAQKMDAVGQLTGGVAHDFNNILTVITGTIEILSDAVAHDPQLVEIAAMIDQAAQRGAELTQHLLAFSRKQPLIARDTDINSLVTEATKLLRPSLGEQIEIEAALEEDCWPALVDPAQLTAALLNLAVNARDAMPGGGKLTLESGNVILDEGYAQAHGDVAPGPYVMIAVSDTGHGIPAAIRDKVFEPFFTTKDVGKGTGLGLSMVYGFIKQSGGHIKVYSEEGHGTTIKLYLPRGTAKLDVILTPPPLAGGHETIFVVEDDDMVREFLVTQLHSLGYKTVTAASGVAALAKVDNGVAFDLLFTDVIMPGGINGRQLADEVAKRRPGMKVLYTSGYTENAIIHHGRLDAGVLLLAKPYRKTDLGRILRLALGTPGIVQSTPPDAKTAATDRRP